MLRVAGKILLGFVLFLLWSWATLAVYFSNLPGFGLRSLAAGAFALGFLLAFLFYRKRWRTVVLFLSAFAAIVVWWNQIPPPMDADWRPEVAVMASASFHGDLVTVRNIRNFDYATEDDFTVRYYDRTYDLKKLKTIDFIICYWDDLRAVAHTMFSFGFEGGEYLVLSVEVRKEKGEGYSGLKGFFKQYNLIYILGDEQDLVRLRTIYRGERVYLYPTTLPVEKIRELFLNVLHRVNELAEEPEFYNTLGNNCTTNLLDRLNAVSEHKIPYHRKLLMNGYSDELAYERGNIAADLPFNHMKEACLITRKIKGHGGDPDFSRRIRAQREIGIRCPPLGR